MCCICTPQCGGDLHNQILQRKSTMTPFCDFPPFSITTQMDRDASSKASRNKVVVASPEATRIYYYIDSLRFVWSGRHSHRRHHSCDVLLPAVLWNCRPRRKELTAPAAGERSLPRRPAARLLWTLAASGNLATIRWKGTVCDAQRLPTVPHSIAKIHRRALHAT